MSKKLKWILAIILLTLTFVQIGVLAQEATNSTISEEKYQALQTELETIIKPMLEKGKVGVYIKSLTDNRVLYEANAELPLIPASNQKIVTSVGAYYIVGPDYRYRTELYMDERMVLVGDYYFGDVAVKGYGDPMFQYPALIQMLKESPLVKATNFRGHLYIDDTVFDAERFGKDWNYEFSKEVGAIIFRDTNLAKPGDASNTVPVNVGRTMQMIFRPLKIKHKGKIYAGQPVPDGMKLISAVESEPLLQIMGYGNKASDNSILEQIFKTISAVKIGQGSAVGTEQVLKDFYSETMGLDPQKYAIKDGSGLSRTNLISPLYLAKMLEYVYTHPQTTNEVTLEEAKLLVQNNQHPYINTLAAAGEEGTLSERMLGLRVYGKTGTLNGVDALSGYVVTASGNIVVFSFLVNDFTVSRSQVRSFEDLVVRKISEGY